MPRAVQSAIWGRHPEPTGTILKTSVIDDGFVNEAPKSAAAKSSVLRQYQRNYAVAVKPPIALAMAVDEDDAIPAEKKRLLVNYARESILMFNHAASVIKKDRRQAITHAFGWSEHFVGRTEAKPTTD